MKQESYLSLIAVYKDDIKDQMNTIECARNTILALKKEIKVIEKELKQKQVEDVGIPEPEEKIRPDELLPSGRGV